MLPKQSKAARFDVNPVNFYGFILSMAQFKRFIEETRASQRGFRLAASAHPTERIKSISRLKFNKKNIQNSGTLQ